MTLRYSLIGSYKAGYELHPQLAMKGFGYTVISYEGVPIGDCAIIEVEQTERLENFDFIDVVTL